MSLNKEKNFVSAVVYLYNNEREVGGFLKTVNDLLKENFEKYEIVCVNDCSTDGTVKAVENFCEENSVKSLTVINTSFFQGVESAMVAGVDISIGDFVFEFDSPVVDYAADMIMAVYRKSHRVWAALHQSCSTTCSTDFQICSTKSKHSVFPSSAAAVSTV